jgi:thiol-disulfide isomerase/thioredoxin
VRPWSATAAVLGLLTIGAGAARAQESGLAIGTRAPAVVVKDLDGVPVDLARYIGTRPVLLEFWATWCEVCEALLPTVRAARQEFGDRVEFFGINVTINQTRERVQRYVEAHQPPFRTLYDEEGVSVRAYDAPTTSYIVIIDRAGKVAYTGTGATQDLAIALRAVTAQ